MADDYALAQRLDFMRLDNETQDTIRSLRPLIQKAIGPALDDFYARVRQTPEVSRFFSNPNHMDSAKSRQASHWGIIAEANYGDSYARGVRAIGETHARLGLEPRWYIGGYALVAEKLMEAVVAEAFPKAGLQMVKPGQGAKAPFRSTSTPWKPSGRRKKPSDGRLRSPRPKPWTPWPRRWTACAKATSPTAFGTCLASSTSCATTTTAPWTLCRTP